MVEKRMVSLTAGSTVAVRRFGQRRAGETGLNSSRETACVSGWSVSGNGCVVTSREVDNSDRQRVGSVFCALQVVCNQLSGGVPLLVGGDGTRPVGTDA